MNLTRRQWLASAAAGLAPSYFGLHPFLAANPKAVFVLRTRVPAKMDSAAKRQAGLDLASQIFLPQSTPGLPLSTRVVIKPNVTSVRTPGRALADDWGTGTDPDFYEGLLLALTRLGLSRFHFLEANMFDKWNLRGFSDINDRYGVLSNDVEPRASKLRDCDEVTWSRVPDPVVFHQIPHFAPVNQPDTWLLNVAKWKAHSMGLTQAAKNVQGMIVLPWTRFCQGWQKVTGVPDSMKPDIHPQAEPRLQRYFENHQRNGYRRYQGDSRKVSPIAQEIWAHKTCDHWAALRARPSFHIIEGIIGRDGDGFSVGTDYLTNLVLFGQDPFRLDIIGLYLGGHEPGNVNLYRIAKERGLTDTFNPWDVPLFEWTAGGPQPAKLSSLPRTPLRTPYLRLPNEPEYHLVNEVFDYDKYKV